MNHFKSFFGTSLPCTAVSVAAAASLFLLEGTARAGAEPNLLDDERGNVALQGGLSTAYSAAAALAGLGDPLVMSPFPIHVPLRVIEHPEIHNLYWDDDWEAHNPDAPTRSQIDAGVAALTSSGYFDAAAEYGVSSPSFNGSHGSSTFCLLDDPGPHAEFIELVHWVGCETAVGSVGGLFPSITGVPNPDDDNLYSVYLPTTADLVDGSCDAPAYHFYTSVPDVGIECFPFPPFCAPTPFARTVPYTVVVTKCLSSPRTLDDVMRGASHEIIEASTDPFVGTGWINASVITDAVLSSGDITSFIESFSSVALDLKVGEASDICEPGGTHTDPPASQHPTPAVNLPASDPALGQDHIQVETYWSNAQDRCVPLSPPIAKCKDITLDADNTCHGKAIAPAAIDNGSTDDKGPPVLTIDHSGAFPLGTTTVTLTATDSDMLTDTCTATVTVRDVMPPVVTCPVAVDKLCTGASGGVPTFTTSAVDNCGGASSPVCTRPSGTSQPLGTVVDTCTATDPSGNAGTCTFNVTVLLGDDPVCCPAGTHIILGTSNNDPLNGTSGSDCIIGRGGQDRINGNGGNDFISGGDGDDIISGGPGNDVIFAGSGQDQVTGDADNDFIDGGDGDDQCFGGDGNDTVLGGQGQDRLFGENGDDSLVGQSGDDRLDGGAGNDSLTGSGLHDTCTGGAGTNTFLMCQTQL
jgi:hypothetical protein